MTAASLPRAATVALFGGLVVVGSALGATPAQAHNYLVSSTPRIGETVTELPEAFVITTNDQLLDLGGQGRGFALQVTDDAGLFYGDGCVSVAGPSMSAPVSLGAAGTYHIEWQVVSADGHAVSDGFDFAWTPDAAASASASASASTGQSAPPTCGAESSTASTGPATADSTDAADSTAADSTAADSTAADSTATADSTGAADSAPMASTALWIGGAAGAVLIAIVLTAFLTRRRPSP